MKRGELWILVLCCTVLCVEPPIDGASGCLRGLDTLPGGELIAQLASLTNTRIIRDTESSAGRSVTLDSFPDWVGDEAVDLELGESRALSQFGDSIFQITRDAIGSTVAVAWMVGDGPRRYELGVRVEF